MPFGFTRQEFIILLLTLFDVPPTNHRGRELSFSNTDHMIRLLTIFDEPYGIRHSSIFDDLPVLMVILDAPSLTLFDTRTTLFFDDDANNFQGRDVFAYLSNQRRQFFESVGETPETFLDLYRAMARVMLPRFRNRDPVVISRRNLLLMTLMWLRSYPSYSILSLIFEISQTHISRTIHVLVPILHTFFQDEIRWPTRREWRQMRGHWPTLGDAVGCIDGTSHRLLRPQTEPQHLYYSGHRHFHCVHTQVIIDNQLTLRHVEAGFMGHVNDAQSYRLMTAVGDGRTLDLPRDCFLLGDCIYPSHHPIITPFTQAQLHRQPFLTRQRNRRLNREIRRKRVYIEHVIHLIKMFRVIGTLYRHQRRHIAQIVCLCAFLAERRARLFFRW